MWEDERSGPFENRVSDEEIRAFIEQQAVADEVDYRLQTAWRRLKQLHQDGEIRQKDVGRRFVW